ncbi:MAG TPA: TRAP transporter small permease subunit [Devosia sp.]|nr:TRAP transporter small permease subunit [Devosia sp.]
MSLLWERTKRAAHGLSVFGMFKIFAIFIYGVGMRHLGHPQSWVDEVVTILAVWVVFFTSAFVLKWRDFITFDMLFLSLPPKGQRISMVVACLGFVAVIGYVFYAIVDYVVFMGISTTDMVEIPLSYINSIFPAFLAGISMRLLILAWRLSFGDHAAALAELSYTDVTDEVVL